MQTRMKITSALAVTVVALGIGGFTADLANADVLVPTTGVTAHNKLNNHGGTIEDITSGSGMNLVAPTDPSTWTCTSTSYGNEWPGRKPLDFATYGKVGWAGFDLGAVKDNLQDLYIWNGRENTSVGWLDYNVYYATSPTVPLPPAPTATANDYDFSSAGWTKVNSTVLTLPTNRNAPPDAIVDLGGVSARYIAMEAISRRSTGDRCALAEIAITQTDSTPPTLIPGDIDDDNPGGSILANELVTYTVTFSEDIDGTTVSSDDFDNGAASPSDITYVSITETDYGVFTLEIQPTTPGNLQLRVPTGATIKDLSGNSLGSLPILDVETIEVTSDITPPTLAGSNIVDDVAGGPITVGTLVTYTVTFSEDIDAGTVEAADFTNGAAGAATISFGTITEPLVGEFEVQVTPTSSGNLQLQVAGAAVIKDLAGNSLASLPIGDDTTIVVDGTAPTLAGSDMVDDKGGGSISQYALVTYTLTFSEDIDETTVSSADFSNAGTASVTFGTISETAAGVFAVQVQPTTTGTLQLQVPGGADIRDVAGNALGSLPIVDATPAMTVSALDTTTLAPISTITAHHVGQGAGITLAIDGSGMTKADPLDPSTWTRTSSGWTDEWQATAILNAGSSINGKIGWLAFDLGSSTPLLQDLYLWNCAQSASARVKEFNIYYCVTLSVALPAATGTATDYDFASGGWTRFNPSVPMLLPSGVTSSPQGIVNLGGISARYVALEVITNYGNTSRAGMAEIGLTLQPPPSGTMIMIR
ncbi:MAG: hypothetical protein HN919_20115 [Verrucomicrobia bacterium]|jgi:hypothetical protein|nr:hypothetical protein [Verrucomicrobiota bacterium]MBT7068612.1 hypothetical protein [Verrucomicrobiota bacterium]MBT7701781.1 hypothetical protein [Verrucomicrobiota bacterium]